MRRSKAFLHWLRRDHREACQILAPVLVLTAFLCPLGAIHSSTTFDIDGLHAPRSMETRVLGAAGMGLALFSPVVLATGVVAACMAFSRQTPRAVSRRAMTTVHRE